MQNSHLMVIDPSLKFPEVESYNKIVFQSSIKSTYHLPALHSSKSMLYQFKDTSALIIMGSASSVHDSFEWINDIEIIIKKAIKRKLPILGICFGHQLIAHMFGGKVEPLWKGLKKRGVRKVKIFKNNSLIDSREDYLIYSHKEGVTECPQGFAISASSEMVKIDGLVHHELPIWSFQTHIEASEEFANRTGLDIQDYERALPCSSSLIKAFLKKVN